MADCPHAGKLREGQECAVTCDCPAAVKVMERLRQEWAARNANGRTSR